MSQFSYKRIKQNEKSFLKSFNHYESLKSSDFINEDQA